jgi:sugar O-acyltransferase (sialic acid O-acetyltransferase NeuD family)
MDRILIFGWGAQAKVVLEILSNAQEFKAESIFTLDQPVPQDHESYPILMFEWEDASIKRYKADGITKAIVVHADNNKKALYINKVKSLGFDLINLIHPRACVATTAQLGCNIIVNANAVIHSYTSIADGTVVHSLANIGHNCNIGRCCNISPGAVLGGWVQLGEGSYIYLNSTVINNIKVGKHSIVGAGSMVVTDVPDNTTVMGNPAKTVWITQSLSTF